MKKRNLIAITLAGACFSAHAHSAWYSTTIDMNSYVANGQNFATSIDLVDYLPSSSGMRTTIDSVSVKLNFVDDSYDPQFLSHHWTEITDREASRNGNPYNVDWYHVPPSSRFVGEENRGYSGDQLMFVDIWQRDFQKNRSYELENAAISLALPDGSNISTATSTFATPWTSGLPTIIDAGATYTDQWGHYSCAIGAHYCHDSIHDYYTLNRLSYIEVTQNNAPSWSVQIDPDVAAFVDGTVFGLNVLGDFGDMMLASVEIGMSATTSPISSVPEPGSLGLYLGGLGLIGFMARRRQYS